MTRRRSGIREATGRDDVPARAPHYRNCAEGVARAIAEELGAEVIYADLMEKEHGGSSALY